MIIIGSTALWLHGLNRANPADFDVLVPIGTKIEDYDCIPIPHYLLRQVPYEEYRYYDVGTQRMVTWKYATLDALLTLKCAHFHLDIAWEKTKLDILWLMSNGAKILPTLFKVLKTHWDQDKGRKIEVSLNMSAAEFFSTGTNFPYEHDQLHLWASGLNPPMYTQCLVDGQEVLVSRDKFKLMPINDQLQMIREEIAVIACERWLLNPKTKVNSLVPAWQYALRKVITTLMKGYFSEFVIHHLPQFIQVDWELLDNILINTKYKEDNMDYTLLQEFIDLMQYHRDEAEENDDYVVFESQPEGVTQVEQEGGESEGEYAHTVWEYKGEYFRLDYNYYSYSGYDNVELSSIRQVKKVERTVSFFE